MRRRYAFSWSQMEPPWDYGAPWPLRVAVRWGVTIAGLAAAELLISGIEIEGLDALLLAAALVVVVRAVLRPLLILLTCPLQVLTLGLFLFVVNAIVLAFAGWLSGALGVAFDVDGFGAAFLGALVISAVSYAVDRVLRAQARGAKGY